MAQKWTCKTCGKEFDVGDWTCSDGISNHIVEQKIYRSLDAPQEPGYAQGGKPLETSSYGQTVVCSIPPAKKQVVNGELQSIGEGSVTFIRGRFATTDPEKQYWLDMRPAYNATEEQWQACWLSQKQQLDLERQKLADDRTRLENDRNELLAQTKSKAAR